MKMKKSVITLAIILGLGAGTASVVNARGCDGRGPGYGKMNGGGYGYGMMNRGHGMRGYYGHRDADNVNYKKFLDQTTELRKSIAVDQAELNALMAGDNPDAKRVRELTANIVENQENVAEIAQTSNVGGGAGYFCNGPGFGRRN